MPNVMELSDDNIGRITVFVLGKNFQKLFRTGFQRNKIMEFDCCLSARFPMKLLYIKTPFKRELKNQLLKLMVDEC